MSESYLPEQYDLRHQLWQYKVLHGAGSGFVIGLVGGSVWHGIKGARNAPKGCRLQSAFAEGKTRGPVLAGNFAAWSGLFSASNCLVRHVRQKEDVWNWVLAGAATDGCLAVRSGPKRVFSAAVWGAVIMSVFEGVGACLEYYSHQASELPRPSTGEPSVTTSS